MSEDAELLAIHHTALAQWAVRQVGRALLVGTTAAVVALVVLYLASEGDPDSGEGWAALAVGFFTFSLTLATVRAPLPHVMIGDDA